MTELVTRDFTGHAADGYPLSMRLVSAAEPRMAVLVSSGTGFPKGFYERFARHLAERGAAVLTYDFRGIAGSRPDDLKAMAMDYPDWGRLDMPAALDALIEAAPGLRVVHVGHSVGGHFLGFMHNQDRIERHAFVSVGTGWWGGHHRSYNPLELFFWLGFGPFSPMRHGYIKGGGLWGGTDLPTTVMPFILRNVRLQGVDSVMTPPARRAEAWARLVKDLPESFYAQAATEITLADAPKLADAIINNQVQGRTLVKVK